MAFLGFGGSFHWVSNEKQANKRDGELDAFFTYWDANA
jgi:hypothetical protein